MIVSAAVMIQYHICTPELLARLTSGEDGEDSAPTARESALFVLTTKPRVAAQYRIDEM